MNFQQPHTTKANKSTLVVKGHNVTAT